MKKIQKSDFDAIDFFRNEIKKINQLEKNKLLHENHASTMNYADICGVCDIEEYEK